MICGLLFGFIFIIAGIYQIATGRGYDFSKSHREVTGKTAKAYGILSLLIGTAIVAIFLLTGK